MFRIVKPFSGRFLPNTTIWSVFGHMVTCDGKRRMLQYIVLFPLMQHDIPTGFGSDPFMKNRRFFRYNHSFLTTSENENMDAQGLRRLRRISLVLLGLEAAVFFWFVLSGIGRDKPLQFLAPAIVALVSGTVLYRNQVLASVGAVRMRITKP